jgi:hypothetical protein
MKLDRRVPFFAIVALICFALVPVADTKLRYVPITTGIVYLVLSVVFLLDWLSRRADRR